MSVTVHMRNGQSFEHQNASTCTWKQIGSKNLIRADQPRWLICTNERGDIVASYQENEVNGFRRQNQTAKRFSFPSIRNLRSRS
ncbi:MAG: hypothetical protein EA415_01175 [Sphaerobacteraceae bacterium]|nr:MAG: hypothetical protein EA415_01175 [Sphaerobacteraceae bacterium]